MKEKLKTFVIYNIGEISIAITVVSAIVCALIWTKIYIITTR